jgi:hypothetical protein
MNVLLPWRPISGIQGNEAGLAINGGYPVWMLHAKEGIGIVQGRACAKVLGVRREYKE